MARKKTVRRPPTHRMVTAKEVAKLAGVSTSAVSRTFTEGASASSKTREKVLSAAQIVGYEPEGREFESLRARHTFPGSRIAYRPHKSTKVSNVCQSSNCTMIGQRIPCGRSHAATCFFNLGHRQHSGLTARLGCKFEAQRGDIISNRHEATNVPGIFVAGDAAWHSDMAIIAAAEGAIAALAINTELLRTDIKGRSSTVK